jgi:deoxyribose-phosphate aldolase
MQAKELAGKIDGAFLGVDGRASSAALRRAVDDAVELGLRALCVPPMLAGTVKKNYPQLRVAAVVAYPLGLESLAAKVFAISELAEQRVDEVDVVWDLFALVNSNWTKVAEEARRIGELCVEHGLYCKAIIETPILTMEQIDNASRILASSPVQCIKTSTGYHRAATTVEQVQQIRSAAGGSKQIKASGGIRTLAQAEALLDAGADILGMSSARAILAELAAKTEQPRRG